MSLENIDIQQFAQQLSTNISSRLHSLNLPPEELQDNINIIEQFNNIAVDLLKGEAGIELPGASQIIPWDEKTATQGLVLFAEGIYLAMTRCHEMGLPSEIKKKLLQEFAMDVYSQAKQIVASTYGQEHTPEFQLSHEQQVALINQSAESALMYYLNKHEQEVGPIQGTIPSGAPQTPITAQLPPLEAPSLPPQTRETPEIQVPPPVSAPTPPPRPTKGPTPHDKYGAVALLLNTLPASHRAKILQNFNSEEKELISFYSYPQHIEQNLDIRCVEEHLKRFKQRLQEGGSTLKSPGHQGLLRLAEQYPMEKLLSYVKDERLVVKQYLASIYQPSEHHPLAQLTQKSEPAYFKDLLSPRIEGILYQHLSRRLG